MNPVQGAQGQTASNIGGDRTDRPGRADSVADGEHAGRNAVTHPCILLVEDDPVSSAFLQDALRGLPAEVLEAAFALPTLGVSEPIRIPDRAQRRNPELVRRVRLVACWGPANRTAARSPPGSTPELRRPPSPPGEEPAAGSRRSTLAPIHGRPPSGQPTHRPRKGRRR